MIGENRNFQFLVNVLGFMIPSCMCRNAQTLGVNPVQLQNAGAASAVPLRIKCLRSRTQLLHG